MPNIFDKKQINTQIYKQIQMTNLFYETLNGQKYDTSVYLSVLCEVMVQQLGVGLLVRWQDVQEGSRGVTRSTPRVQGPRSPQC